MSNSFRCDCLTDESIRQELIENCGLTLDILICCCGTVRSTISIGGPVTVLEVGEDFVEVATGTAPVFTSILVIPIKRIGSFIELGLGNRASNCDCGTCEKIEEELSEFCGQNVTVSTCLCGTTPAFFGADAFALVEVSQEFIELRNISSVLQEVDDTGSTIAPGQDIVIPLNYVCYVQKPIAVPTTSCPR